MKRPAYRRNSVIRKQLLRVILVLASAAAVFLIISFVNGKTQAEESVNAHKQYTSITICPGDSLWSIATEYIDGHYTSMQEYINEVKTMNHLTSDTINAFEYLLVPYYIG